MPLEPPVPQDVDDDVDGRVDHEKEVAVADADPHPHPVGVEALVQAHLGLLDLQHLL